MKSNVLKVPGWDADDHSSSPGAGLTGQWLPEGGTATETYAKARQIELNTKKLAIYTSASNELIADGIDIERQIGNMMIKTSAWTLDDAILNGTGAGQPLGILNASCLITVAGEGGQAGSPIIHENVVKIYARLAPQCYAISIWLASATCVPQLLSLSFAVGTGGVPSPVVSYQNGQFVMMGRPVVFSEKMPALGSAGCLALVDPTQYALGMRKEVSIDKSVVPGWTTDTMSFRTILRADGMPMWDTFITPKNGDSLSCFVAIDAI